MKNIIKVLLLLFIVAGTFLSCSKKENRDYLSGGTAPAFSATVSGNIPLSFANQTQTALTVSWTNPNYQFTTGLSSQTVTYTLEIDTTGSNFTNPNREILTLSPDVSHTFTQSELNDYLLNQLQLVAGMQHNIEMRITSYLPNKNAPLVSNVLKFTVTPYAIPPKVTPPSSGTLYIVGSATQGGSSHGWDNPISQTVAAQQFTKVSATFYTITLPLIGGGEYKLIGVNGSWTDQWSTAVNDDPNELYGGDFVYNGQNVLAPPVSGSYRIDVDFQRGKFVVTKL